MARLEPKTIYLSGSQYEIWTCVDQDDLLDALMDAPEDSVEVQDERLPYWAELWPSAIALADYVEQYPDLVQGKNVIELGCGIGFSGMVAKRLGAEVLLTDYVPQALELAAFNWEKNHMPKPATRLVDWRNVPEELTASVILASDVVYEKRFFKPLLKAFRSILSSGGVVLLSEPDRELADDFFHLLEDEEIPFVSSPHPIDHDGRHHPVTIYEIGFVKEVLHATT